MPNSAPAPCPECGRGANGRKPYWRSYKVRCAWIASLYPIAAAGVWLWTGQLVPAALVGLGMAPWMALGGTEGIIDWKTAPAADGGAG